MATVNAVDFLNAKIEAQGSRIDALESRIDARGAKLTSAIDAWGAKIDAQGAELQSAIDARGAKLRSALDARGAKIDARGTELRAALDARGMVLATNTTLLRWMMGIVIALFAAVMLLLVLRLREPQLPAGAGVALRQTFAASSRDTMPARVDLFVTPESPSPARYRT